MPAAASATAQRRQKRADFRIKEKQHEHVSSFCETISKRRNYTVRQKKGTNFLLRASFFILDRNW